MLHFLFESMYVSMLLLLYFLCTWTVSGITNKIISCQSQSDMSAIPVHSRTWNRHLVPHTSRICGSDEPGLTPLWSLCSFIRSPSIPGGAGSSVIRVPLTCCSVVPGADLFDSASQIPAVGLIWSSTGASPDATAESTGHIRTNRNLQQRPGPT